MCKKSKYLILILIQYSFLMSAQEESRFRYVDSLTWKYYTEGDWDKLVSEGNNAIEEGIDFKFLRQRLGHAAFIKGDYYKAIAEFEKAYAEDSYDYFTNEYLYYSFLNTGKEQNAGLFARRMKSDLQKSLSLKSIIPFESFELEYAHKFSGSWLRSDPDYLRLAFTSKPGYRISLYQSFSKYLQQILLQPVTELQVNQTGYFALLSWTASRHLSFRSGYHFINTHSGTAVIKGNLFLLAVAPDFNRLTLEASGSLLNMGEKNVYQASLKAGYAFPGRSGIYVRTGAALISAAETNQLILSPAAGCKLWKGAWLELNLSSGEMNGYNDFNGLYVYDTYDPMVLRSGCTFTYYVGKKACLWLNYSYEKKKNADNISTYYNQFSTLGGIKWKM